MKKILSLFIIFISIIGFSNPLYAQQAHNEGKTDGEEIIFRFLPGNLMFYDSQKLNFRSTLNKALDLINSHKDAIQRGDAVVVIHGYCTSFVSDEMNRKAAKNRSNQVKSYFITNYWMKENFYKTRNHITPYKGMKDIVAVVGVEYLPGYGPAEEKPVIIASALNSKSNIPVPQTDKMLLGNPVNAVHNTKNIQSERTEDKGFALPFIIKSNLVYDAMLAPSLEIEYVINDRWSAGVETSIAWWHNNHKPWFYQIATLIPEVRYRIDARKNGHYHSIGLFGGAGWYDLEYKKTGYQGELWMAGISYSYSFPINSLLGFEAGAGLGFMSTEYEEYLPQDGHFAYQQTTRTKFFGPLRLKFALVFDLNRYFKKGGMK